MQPIVIIPTYNERDNLERLVDAVLAVEPALHVLVIDDNSPDGTGELADAIALASSGRVHVLHRAGKMGLGTAYVAGFRYALARNYTHIVEMDADFSHRPEDLPRLLEATASADVVIGSRNVPGGRAENWSLLRHVISKGGSLYARTILGLSIRDCTGGFKCFSSSALASLPLHQVTSNGYGFQVEMNYLCHRAGFQIVEVPIVFPDRKVGQSKMSRNIILEAMLLVWKLRLRRDQVMLPAPISLMQKKAQAGASSLIEGDRSRRGSEPASRHPHGVNAALMQKPSKDPNWIRESPPYAAIPATPAYLKSMPFMPIGAEKRELARDCE
jgi:dolichol-phosphate mannosyltransferase